MPYRDLVQKQSSSDELSVDGRGLNKNVVFIEGRRLDLGVLALGKPNHVSGHLSLEQIASCAISQHNELVGLDQLRLCELIVSCSLGKQQTVLVHKTLDVRVVRNVENPCTQTMSKTKTQDTPQQRSSLKSAGLDAFEIPSVRALDGSAPCKRIKHAVHGTRNGAASSHRILKRLNTRK